MPSSGVLRSWHTLAAAAILLAALAILTGFVLNFLPFTVDDAFIALRYADNLAAGHGLTYNPGLPPAEGYTCFLWVVLLAVPHQVGLDAVAFAKVAGLAATLATMALCLVFVRRLARGPSARWAMVAGSATALLLACYPPTAVHAVSGMETALFALFITLAAYLTVIVVERFTTGTAVALGLVGLLVGLTRPEGNLAVVVGMASAFILLRRECRWRFAACVAASYVLPGIIYFSWRFTYYGCLFPLPFYVKVASQKSLAGLPDVVSLAKHLGASTGILILLGLFPFRRQMLPACLATVSLLVFFLFPAHMMGYDARYLYPVVPFLFVLAAHGAGNAVRLSKAAPEARRPMVRGALVLVALGLIGWMCVAFAWQVGERIRYWEVYANGLRRAHTRLGKHLRRFAARDGRPVLAIGDAGAVPYYSRWRTIDTCGLNEAHIATSGEHDAGYVLDQRPDLVVLISFSGETFRAHLPWEQDLYADGLEAGMEKVGVLTFAQDTYHLWLLAWPGSRVAEHVRALGDK